MKWYRWQVWLTSSLTDFEIAPGWLKYHQKEDALEMALRLNEKQDGAGRSLRWEVRER